jgi:formylglycine-generating enzyme required for sulfatase activity
MRNLTALVAMTAMLAAPLAPTAKAADAGLVLVPAGTYFPFQRVKTENTDAATPASPQLVVAFRIDVEPVRNSEFLAFVNAHPEWRKSEMKPIFGDERYLRRWPSDLGLPDAVSADEPVTNVSWFAAEAYCRARGLRLPTTEQWEYALYDAGREASSVRERALEWIAEPNGPRPGAVGGLANGYGVRDLVGLVWEWTLDFDAYAMTAESRDPNGKDGAQFCGGAAAGVADLTDYPAFMRYSMRASLKASYTANNLGFRCAGGPS